MDGPARTPPRFVPTLTSVVDLKEEAGAAAVPTPLPVPTLDPAPQADPERQPWLAPPRASVPPPADESKAWTEPLVPARTTAALPPGRAEPPLLTEALPSPLIFESESPPSGNPPSLRVEPTFLDLPASLPPVAPAAPSEPAPAPEPLHALAINEEDAFRLEEELLHRVLQRVDLSLEERLTEVVSAAVQQQLDAMVPRLREQVETALRELVSEAMVHELSETPGSAAHSRTKLGLN